MSAYYATPGPSAATEHEQQTSGPVLVAFTGPAPQSRLTVLVRIFMAIPHLIVLALLGIAAEVVVLIGWFGALFTGRLPVFAADFLLGYLRWHTRATAYMVLLTDMYPPFSLEDADYPIRVAAMPGRLNRLAVLFRLFLLIPCWIVQTVVTYGAFTIVQVASWLIVLIKGQMPAALYQALAAALRYQARTLGFAFMLTSAYPAGLFGDAPEPAGYGIAEAQPGYGDSEAQPESGPEESGPDESGPEESGPEESGVPQGAPSPWRLVLSSGARKLMVTFLVLGVLVAAGSGATTAVIGSNTATAVDANNQLQADITLPRDAINNYPASVTACKGSLSCVTRLDHGVAATLDTFAGQVRAISMPAGNSGSQAAALASSASSLASIFARLSTATTRNQYLSIAKSANVRQVLVQLNQNYLNLSNTLQRHS